jgi:hypothetical protein
MARFSRRSTELRSSVPDRCSRTRGGSAAPASTDVGGRSSEAPGASASARRCGCSSGRRRLRWWPGRSGYAEHPTAAPSAVVGSSVRGTAPRSVTAQHGSSQVDRTARS